MDTADQFGSLFDEIPTGQEVQRTAAFGDETSYAFEGPGRFVGPATEHPGLGHTMVPGWPEAPAPVTLDEDPDAALPVTYGEEDPASLATQIAAALAQTTPRPSYVPVTYSASTSIQPGLQSTAGQVLCPKCHSTFAPGQDIEVVAGIGIQHKGACPTSTPAGTTAQFNPLHAHTITVETPESDEERGRRLLAYADAVARGETPAGPNPFEHVVAGGMDSDIAAAAANHLATKTALRTYDPQERQAIIDEGVGVQASNLDRLDITGTHYEALVATRSVPEDEDLTFLDGDPNLGDF